MRNIQLVIAIMCALLVASCGGGGGDSQTIAPPAKTVAYSSAGDVSKYLGKWSIGCSMTMVTSVDIHNTTKFINITSANGGIATGTLTTNDYGKNSCYQGTPSTTTSSFTIQYISTSPVDNSDFSGFADQIKYTPFNSASQSLYSSFNQGFNELRFSSSTNLSKIDGIYTKQ